MAGPLEAFVVVYGTIALIELLDRTHFAVIGLASRQPFLPTWAGASVAFVVTTSIAILLGTLLIALVGGDLRIVQLGGGVVLLGFVGYLVLVPESERRPPEGRSAFATALLLILLLELGDATMILIVIFAGSTGSPLLVLLAGVAALSTVALVGTTIGSRIGARVEPKLLDRVVQVILAIVGLLTIALALDPSLGGGLL